MIADYLFVAACAKQMPAPYLIPPPNGISFESSSISKIYQMDFAYALSLSDTVSRGLTYLVLFERVALSQAKPNSLAPRTFCPYEIALKLFA